ncbi:hypothetical protein [Pseudoalteromonas obscura]|uniref:Uncharacterized protein n=1 Tax=Pseudoalteromonas obscura TaxID=3048491 RepID=A0ABT7EH97_9GAMM|nr:hypothetical protein [Pseudoalteromonas sp. P94(2023)]MDK2594432.1 hypothetical protein [Pseudoalteromonas sp. P94(2023)]
MANETTSTEVSSINSSSKEGLEVNDSKKQCQCCWQSFKLSFSTNFGQCLGKYLGQSLAKLIVVCIGLIVLALCGVEYF